MDERSFSLLQFLLQLLLQRDTGLLLLSHGLAHASDLHAEAENKNRFHTGGTSLSGSALPGMSFKISLS